MSDASGWQPPDPLGAGSRGQETAALGAPKRALSRPAARTVDLALPDLPLRPLAVGELLDGAIAVVRSHLGTVYAVAGVTVVAEQLLGIAIRLAVGGVDGLLLIRTGTGSAVAGAGGLDALLSGAGVAVLILQGSVTMLLAGLLAPLVADALRGRPSSAAALRGRVRPRLPALVLTALVAGAVPWLALPLFGFGVFLWGALSLATPALVLEGCGGWAALGRSWRLAVGGWWRVWGVRALGSLVATVIGAVIVLPLTVIGVATAFDGGSLNTLPTGIVVLSLVLGFLVRLLVAPFEAVLLTLIYLDRRMRAEALDIVLAVPALAQRRVADTGVRSGLAP